MKARFLKSAIRDMQAIKDFIARDNPATAARLMQTLRQKTGRMEPSPNSGRIIPETMEPHLRELVISNYRVMVQITQKKVTVFAVYESHRLYPSEIAEKER
jgi:toxin ParE1/3/4